MPRQIRLSAALVAAVGFLAAAPRASADTITITLDNGGTPVSYNPNGGASVTEYAGPFHWTQTAPTSANITTYCIDLTHYISTGGTYTYTTVPVASLVPLSGDGTGINTTAKVNAIDALFNKYYTISQTSAADSAAFQLALWKLEYDGPSSSPTSLTTGTIQLAGDTKTTLAQEMLNGTLPSSYNDLANASLVALISGTSNQNQIEVVPNPPVAGVPAPPALMLAGIGVLGLVGRARWARSAVAAA
jgi:hypothetical protein